MKFVTLDGSLIRPSSSKRYLRNLPGPQDHIISQSFYMSLMHRSTHIDLQDDGRFRRDPAVHPAPPRLLQAAQQQLLPRLVVLPLRRRRPYPGQRHHVDGVDGDGLLERRVLRVRGTVSVMERVRE